MHFANVFLRHLGFSSLLLNYPAKDNAYFVRCKHCKDMTLEDPVWAKEWEIELNKAQKTLEARVEEA